MDRVLPREIIVRQRNLNIAKATAILVTVIVAMWVIVGKLKTSVKINEITISEAAMGPIEISMSASLCTSDK